MFLNSPCVIHSEAGIVLSLFLIFGDFYFLYQLIITRIFSQQIIEMTCKVEVEDQNTKNCETKLSLLLRFEDQMNRQLNCAVAHDETGVDLANELVHYGLISEVSTQRNFGK